MMMIDGEDETFRNALNITAEYNTRITALLFSMSMSALLNQSQGTETGLMVYRPYPRRCKVLTICRC